MSRPQIHNRAALAPLLRSHILAGGVSKDFPYPDPLSKQYLCKRIYEIGFVRVYLTDEERRHIMRRRKGANA